MWYRQPLRHVTKSLVVSIVGFLSSELTFAHTPHDRVAQVRYSPNFNADNQIFAIVRSNLFRSIDGGDTWKRWGHGLVDPEGLTTLAISPSFATDETMLVASKSGRVYRSENEGVTWTQAGPPLDPDGIVLFKFSRAFQTDHVVLAVGVSGGLYRSADGGSNWQTVPIHDNRVAAIAVTNDALVAMTPTGTAFLLSDDGVVWRSAPMATTGQTVTCMETPDGTTADGPFYFGTAEDGVYVAARDGDVYKARRVGLSGKHITSLTSTKGRDGQLVLFATTWSEALFRSDDGGATWHRGHANLTTDDQADIFGYPHFKGIAIANDFATQPTVYLGAYDGLFKSTDGGATWRELDTLSHGLIVGFDLTTDEQGGLVIGASTYTAGTCFFHARDMSWRVANVGLVNSRVGAIAFSPDFATDKTVFVGMWGRVGKSTDGGARWHTAHLWSSTIRWLAWSLGIDNRSPIFPRIIAVSPNFDTDGTLFVGMRQSGLYSSTDAGETYSELWDTNGKPVLALAFSPTFADDSTAVAVLTDGLYKTIDRGHSWLPIRNCDGPCRPALAMSPDFRRDQTIFAADQSGLLRTQDGGATWQSISTAQCCHTAVDSIVLSPAFATDHELLVSLTGLGLLRSRDGGRSFESVAQSVTDLGVSLSRFVDFPDRAPSVKYSTRFADDRTIVASSWETLFLSSDRGERWSPIPTPPIRYENTHSAIIYHGSWQLSVRDDRYSGTSAAASEAPGAEVVMRFVGRGFRLLASQGPDQGTAELSLDGEVIMEIDQYAPNKEYVVVSAARMDLAPGPHELRLKVTGSRSTASLGTRVELDSVDVFR